MPPIHRTPHAARKLVAEKYSWAKIAEDFGQILAEVAAKTARKAKPPSLAGQVVKQ